MEPTVLPTRQGYDLWADIYDHEENPLIAMEEPRVDELLGAVDGLRVLDLGCGTGRHALRLAERGARVEGVDFSDGMLRKARAKDPLGRVRWHQHDLTKPLSFTAGTFDRIICGLVLDHIEDLPGFFAAHIPLLAAGGFGVYSVMHPALLLLGTSARFTDPTTGGKVYPRSVPHQLSDYVMAALAGGLRLDHLSEHVVPAALADKLPRARKYVGWPMLLMMRLRHEAASNDR